MAGDKKYNVKQEPDARDELFIQIHKAISHCEKHVRSF